MNKIGMFKDNSDNTLKCVYKSDNKIIEMSLLFNKKDRNVICVPTHNFCCLGCKMCHLTNNKLNKKMIPIIYEDFINCLIDSLKSFDNKEKLLISFMGVGEPLLNMELIKKVFLNEKVIKSKYGYKYIGYSISTMMPIDNLDSLINVVKMYKIPLKLHFSLHSTIDKTRASLVPSSKVNIKDAFNLLCKYREEVSHDDEILTKYKVFHSNFDFIELHYTLINNLNDSNKELNNLIFLEKKYMIPIKFIKFNPKEDLKISEKEDKWVNTIKKIDGLIIKKYNPPGHEVGASCGEFTKHYYHEEIETKKEREEFMKWKITHEIK